MTPVILSCVVQGPRSDLRALAVPLVRLLRRAELSLPRPICVATSWSAIVFELGSLAVLWLADSDIARSVFVFAALMW